MTVKELIQELQEIDKLFDGDLDVRIQIPTPEYIEDDFPNFWVCDVEIHHTGESGYELHGEVILTGQE